MTEPSGAQFKAGDLYGSVIAQPLLEQMRAESSDPEHRPPVHRVVIELNNDYADGREAAALRLNTTIRSFDDLDEGPDNERNENLDQYIVARLSSQSIRTLASDFGRDTIHRIWPDFQLRPLVNRSIVTVKADAAWNAFSANGQGIVWAVVDSGIKEDHQHFVNLGTLRFPSPLAHQDFTGGKAPLTDDLGHGTHVAGIIAGLAQSMTGTYRAERDPNGDVRYRSEPVGQMRGMAPFCRLVSYKVLTGSGDDGMSAVLAALRHIDRVNGHGRHIKIHGVNLSVGYPFDVRWFACGASPLCVEVDRLVKSGVVVVAAAGNTGYGYTQDAAKGNVAACQDLTINDPGNAECAITVGSTHREMPHRYGVSYFSSKGPTGDGRAKPDLVAPGERILSCAAGKMAAAALDQHDVDQVEYVEDSGTSMAAAHVSGVIAAFLSVRPEFIGRPEEIKRIFMESATDLGRVSDFQGRGLVDLMRALQSV